MADLNHNITAGLARPKDSGQSPGAGENTFYITAGLAKVVEAAGGNAMPMAMNHYRQMRVA